MKFDWGTVLKVFERASGIPFDEIGTKIKSHDDLKEALQVFEAAPSPRLAKNILDSVYEECDVKALTRLDQKYDGWVNDLAADENDVKRLMAVCDYLSGRDIATAAKFYNDQVLWGADLARNFEEHSLAQSTRLIDYTHKAMAQGQPKAATDCMYQFYHFNGKGDFSTAMQEELEDLFAQAMISYIDADTFGAESWLSDERGVGGPNPAYEHAYYRAMTHLTEKRRTEDRRITF